MYTSTFYVHLPLQIENLHFQSSLLFCCIFTLYHVSFHSSSFRPIISLIIVDNLGREINQSVIVLCTG